MMWFLLSLAAINFAVGCVNISSISIINFAACAALTFMAGDCL